MLLVSGSVHNHKTPNDALELFAKEIKFIK